PEEGELRPQLLDRFGLHAGITTITDVEQRVEIIERRERFDDDPQSFELEWAQEQQKLRKRLSRARSMLPSVNIDRSLLLAAAGLCGALGIDGHRGELTIARAARALAACAGRKSVAEEDVRAVAVMALRHRLRKDPFGNIDSGELVQQALDELLPRAGSRLTVIK